MKSHSWSKKMGIANAEAAAELLGTVVAFLKLTGVSQNAILGYLREGQHGRRRRQAARHYRTLVRAYEDMGVLMATWFSNPRFLDQDGYPIPVKLGVGPRSLAQLIKFARVDLSMPVAAELIRQSPSIRLDDKGMLHVQRKVFVLPDFEIPRAALIIERYLSTLIGNSSGRKKDTHLLLERSCYVPRVNLKTVTPILRDIKTRATAFIDGVDGEIEHKRLRGTAAAQTGEMGVMIFAWTKPIGSSKRSKTQQEKRNQGS